MNNKTNLWTLAATISVSLVRACQICAASLVFLLTAGCGALRPTTVQPPLFYALDRVRTEAPVAASELATARLTAPTLIVNPPRAASGFNSQRIVYVRETHRLEYYAHSEWVDTPARMLAPLIVTALENSGGFRAVVLTPSAAAGDLRLDTEIVRLQHDLSSRPSQVHFTLRAYVVDNSSRQVLDWKEFDESIAVVSEDPYGAVIAANKAVQGVLEKLSVFCAGIASSARKGNER